MAVLKEWTVMQYMPNGDKIPRYTFDNQWDAEDVRDELNDNRESTDLTFYVVRTQGARTDPEPKAVTIEAPAARIEAGGSDD